MIDEQRLLQEFLELVKIDSPPRHEGLVMKLLAEKLRAMGLTVVFDRAGEAVQGEVGNLVATLPATRPDAPPIFLSAHVDTVAPTAGIVPIVEDGVIRTDGTTILGADDKAAVAAILEAVRHVLEADIPHGEVQVLLSICEEVGLKGAEAMDFSLVFGKMGFVFDSGQPVSGIVVHAPTHDRIHAIIHGRKAHAGSAPEQGVSAIQAAASAIAAMKLGRIDSETTANVGTIHGGEATNVIPDRVEIEAEARSRNDQKLQAQVDQMVGAIEQGVAEFGATAEIEVSRHYPGFKLDEDAPVVRVSARAMEAVGMVPQILASGGGSDANVFNGHGIPSVVLGVGYHQIHTTEEWIALADLVATTRVAVSIIETVSQL